MNPAKEKSLAPSTQPALELIALARLSQEVARSNLRALLLANPNYFGDLSDSLQKAILNIQQDTTYESIGGIGYNARLRQLHATIQINQNSGYSGDSHSSCSKEFIRFYLSDDGGKTWVDHGRRVLDVFDTQEPTPPRYTVSIQMSPQEELPLAQKPCRVRVILSWTSPPPPNLPNWTPVWGNVAEAEIRIERSQFARLDAMLNSDSNSRYGANAAVSCVQSMMEVPPPNADGARCTLRVPSEAHLS